MCALSDHVHLGRADVVWPTELFILLALDGLPAHIAVVNAAGIIVAVNKAWRDFANANAPNATSVAELCQGANYLLVSDKAIGQAEEQAHAFAAGLRAVLNGEREMYTLEYVCHSPSEQRWFVGRVTRLPGKGTMYALVAHENISERKRAERRAAYLLEAASALSGVLTSAQVADVLLAQGLSVLGAYSGVVALLNEQGTMLEIARTAGYPE